jgi:diguanylate cyclase (GGDEF)-like protein
MRIIRKNRILEQKAYIDVHTGLPNKSKCEELFSDMSFITEPTACLMFDLNNLKSANDTLGHSAGDQLIASFARVLRNVIPAKDFVGRYGGDEFVVILYDITENTVNSLLTQLHNEVMQFNRCGNNIPISYAQGWAVSTDYTDCTLRTLFDKADHFMYTNKVKVKSK